MRTVSICAARAEAEVERHAGVHLLLVARPGLHLDDRAARQLQVLDARQRHPAPRARQRAGVAQAVQRAIRRERRRIEPPVVVEVRGGERGGAGQHRSRRRGIASARQVAGEGAVDQQVGKRAVLEIAGRNRVRGGRRDLRRLPPRSPVQQDGQPGRAAGDQVDPAVVVHVARQERGGAGAERVERIRAILAAEQVPVQHGRAVRVGHDDVAAGRVGDEAERHAVDGMPADEREVLRLIAEAGRPVVALYGRRVAEEQQVEIVVVVVVDPDDLPDARGGERHRGLREHPLRVRVERHAGVGDDRQVREAVVVEVPRRDGPHPLDTVEACVGRRRIAVPEEAHGRRRPREQIRAAVGVRVEHEQARAAGRESPGQRRIGERHRHRRPVVHRVCRIDGVEDFRVEAPVEIFGDRRSRLTALEVLEDLLLARGVGGAPGVAVGVEELEVRPGEIRVEFGGALELAQRLGGLVGELVQVAEVVVGDRFVGYERDHLLELGDGLVVLRVLLIGNPQVEPGVGQRRVLFLHAEQLVDGRGGLARAQQREPVVQPLARGIGCQVQRLLELVDRLELGRRVLVEGLAEIAVLPQLVGALPRRLGREGQESEQRGDEQDGSKHASDTP